MVVGWRGDEGSQIPLFILPSSKLVASPLYCSICSKSEKREEAGREESREAFPILKRLCYERAQGQTALKTLKEEGRPGRI